MKWIDLRSDTVTKPTGPMLEAMVRAEVGDDVYGEDPTVNLLQKARRWRKVLGGGMRQAAGLSEIKGIEVDPAGAQTNILFVDIKADILKLHEHLRSKRIIIDQSNHLRLVTHLDIETPDIDRAIEAFKSFFTG